MIRKIASFSLILVMVFSLQARNLFPGKYLVANTYSVYGTENSGTISSSVGSNLNSTKNVTGSGTDLSLNATDSGIGSTVDSLETKDLTVLFTHDVHSNLTAFARAKTVINQIKKTIPEPLLLDGGDFSMGTLYQTVFQTEALELRAMGRVGYDVVAIGNHEFDYRLEGLTNMLNVAKKSGDSLPKVLLSNVDWSRSLPPTPTSSKSASSGAYGPLTGAAIEFYDALLQYHDQPYVILERNGLNIAVFSLMGREADSYAPLSGLSFTDYLEKAKVIVDTIKTNEKADVIVCLSHSGTERNEKKSEDHILAKTVSDIDVIISGHSHTLYRQPIQVGNTVIVSVGSNGKRLGRLDLAVTKGNDGNSQVTIKEYDPILLDSKISGDKGINEFIKESKKMVQNEFLYQYGYTFDQVLAHNPYRFTPFVSFAQEQQEYPLGNIVADSYIYAVKEAEGEAYEKVDVSIAPSGVIRASLNRGDITVSDVFKVSSLGIGKDGSTGYPLVSAYLTGEELKVLAEVDASISTLMPEAQLFMSGLSYILNPNRLLLNRVVDVKLEVEPGVLEDIDDHKLYRVVTDLYATQMMGTLEKKSKGLLSVKPKDKDGKIVQNFEDYILYGEQGEVKEWLALAHFLQSFEKVNGIPVIPDFYSKAQGRKVVAEEASIEQIITKPNKFSIAFISGLTAGVALMVGLLIFIIRKFLRKRKKEASLR